MIANILFWVLVVAAVGFIGYKFVQMQKDSKGGNSGGTSGGGGYTGGGGAGELPKDQIK
jgi:preprotein translocase subunit SecG